MKMKTLLTIHFFYDDKCEDDAQRREDELLKNLEDAKTPLYPGCID